MAHPPVPDPDRRPLWRTFLFGGPVDPEPGTAGEKGSGLGLFLCRTVAERGGGGLTVATSAAGTAFTLTLPAVVGGEG